MATEAKRNGPLTLKDPLFYENGDLSTSLHCAQDEKENQNY